MGICLLLRSFDFAGAPVETLARFWKPSFSRRNDSSVLSCLLSSVPSCVRFSSINLAAPLSKALPIVKIVSLRLSPDFLAMLKRS